MRGLNDSGDREAFPIFGTKRQLQTGDSDTVNGGRWFGSFHFVVFYF